MEIEEGNGEKPEELERTSELELSNQFHSSALKAEIISRTNPISD